MSIDERVQKILEFNKQDHDSSKDKDDDIVLDVDEEQAAKLGFSSTASSQVESTKQKEQQERPSTTTSTSTHNASEEPQDSWDDHRYYNWKHFFRNRDSVFHFFQWLRGGKVQAKFAQQSDQEIRVNLWSLARMLRLLRLYDDNNDNSQNNQASRTNHDKLLGGPQDQAFVLREVTRDLYLGGCPLWVLPPVLTRAAEGLTGKRGVELALLPRKGFLYLPNTGVTALFQITRGFDIQRLTLAERTLVRLASFASNTRSVSSLPTRLPTPQELRQAVKNEWDMVPMEDLQQLTQQEMVEQILELASTAEGLFFFINAQDRPVQEDLRNSAVRTTKRETPGILAEDAELDRFWLIEEPIRDLFSRLACKEAIQSIDRMDSRLRNLYGHWHLVFRFFISAGSAGIWFNGSWYDILVAGACGVWVGILSRWSIFSRDERIMLEALASFCVGLMAGVVTITWPTDFCAGAIALGGVLDILQGFRIVFAVVEILSKQTVAGAADFVEGILFTGLISTFLIVGQRVAEWIMGKPSTDDYLTCDKPIDQLWYLLLVPLASLGWSGLFNPMYKDLLLMTMHGVLAYVASWAMEQSSNEFESFNLFVSAALVTLSAGLVSRFTGRQSLGNTVAGLYVLVPGAYLVKLFLFTGDGGDRDRSSEFGETILRAGAIGLGAWAGTLLCSPIMLGITTAQATHRQYATSSTSNYHDQHLPPGTRVDTARARPQHSDKKGTEARKRKEGPMLFF